MHAQGRRPMWLYLLAVAALAWSLRLGWSDFTPWVSQAVVQETIRAAPRQIIQIAVQYIAPALLAGFLASEAAAYFRARRKD